MYHAKDNMNLLTKFQKANRMSLNNFKARVRLKKIIVVSTNVVHPSLKANMYISALNEHTRGRGDKATVIEKGMI